MKTLFFRRYWLVVDASASEFFWRSSLPGVTPAGAYATYDYYRVSSTDGATYTNSTTINSFQINGAPIGAPMSLYWTSNGTSDNWSDSGNWIPNLVPANGDSLTFGVGARTTSYVNYTALSINSLSFNGGPQAFAIHVPESSSSRQLTITNSLTNFSATSPTLIADGASAAGMNSGVLTVTANSMNGPFTLIARGPTGSGTNGGVLELPGFSNASSARIIVEAGAIFDASARTFGPSVASIEGGGTFYLGRSALFTGLSNLSTEVSGTLADGGPSGGVGASLQKGGTGTLILSGPNTYTGGTTVFGGILEVRTPAGLGLGTGSVEVQSAGELLFSQSAAAGFQTFTAHAGTRVHFADTASAGRMTLLVEGTAANATPASVLFEGASRAGTSTNISIGAGTGTNGVRATMIFQDTAMATGATITNHGGIANGATGGVTAFYDGANADSAVIVNERGTGLGYAGNTEFRDTASAGTSVITNQGRALGTSGLAAIGGTDFYGSSTAGAAFITNVASATPTPVQGATGATKFHDISNAGTATIWNEGGVSGGVLAFLDNSTAGGARASIPTPARRKSWLAL